MVGSQGMYRSSSATVLPSAPKRTVSRSPQRPFAPSSASEQERQQKHDAFIKRMSYDARAAAAAARSSGVAGCDGSTERLSQLSGGARRSSHGSVVGLSDGETFASPSSEVAKYSSSMASGINAMSQQRKSGRDISTTDNDDGDAPMDMVRFYRAMFGFPVVSASELRLSGREFDPRPPQYRSVGTGMGYRFRAGIPPRYVSSQPRPNQPPTVCGSENEYRPKCGNALRLEVIAGWLTPFVDKHVDCGWQVKCV